QLLDDSIDAVFADIADDVIGVTTYDATNGEWYIYTPDGDDTNDNLHEMLPGWGYWVLMRNDTDLVIGGSMMRPGILPPYKPVKMGWNLIGYYGADGLISYNGPVGAGGTAECKLSSIGADVFDIGFSSLWTYWEPVNPDPWFDLSESDRMDPGAGYWVFANQDGIYAPVTTCDV
ncbi:MAG: hypothetical protein ABIH41_00480, partial [Nanoarchaeota archaeon]